MQNSAALGSTATEPNWPLVSDEHVALPLSHITWQASSSQPRTPNNGGVGNLEDIVSTLILYKHHVYQQ